MDAADLEQLAAFDVHEWPSLARSWLARGYSSRALEDFAALTPAEGAVLADLMIDVLRSLEVEVGVDRDIAEHVFAVSGFERRCRQTVALAAADLRRTWRDVDVGVASSGPPLIGYAVLGDYNPHWIMLTVAMTDVELVEASAEQLRDILHEQIGVRWPLCRDHGVHMVPRIPAGTGPPSWLCRSHHAPVAKVGELTTRDAGFETMWWADLSQFPLS